MSKTVLLFPGQGSQRVGMGRDLALAHPEARAVFDEADQVLGFALSTLCFDGPEDDLQLTANTQPAILANSIAVFRVLVKRGLTFDYVAGHSLGEWTALVAAGSLSLADGLRLTRLRGQAMQEAVPVGVGAMAALMGLDTAAVDALCAESSTDAEPVSAANFNGAGQIVISGHTDAVDRAIVAAKAAGAKRAVKLSVSAPFHCALMAPARERVAMALAETPLERPSVPVITNVTAEPETDPSQLRLLLARQVTDPVRWEASVQRLGALGVTRAYELGSGAVLRGLVKRIEPRIDVTTIGEPHEVAEFSANS